MSTGAIIAIAVGVVLILIIAAVLSKRAGKSREERRREERRREAAQAHRGAAEQEAAHAELAEREAERARAEAKLHEARADFQERGLADGDRLDRDGTERSVLDDDRDEPTALGERERSTRDV